MRKIFSLGLLALTLFLLSTWASADKIDLCDSVKSYQGLHGLCNAYWNETDPDIQQDILEKYNGRALEQGAPSMPGLATCPCWTQQDVMAVRGAATDLIKCETSVDGSIDLLVYEGQINSEYVNTEFQAHTSFCLIRIGQTTPVFLGPISSDQSRSCRAALRNAEPSGWVDGVTCTWSQLP